jgi:hypothetical protein
MDNNPQRIQDALERTRRRWLRVATLNNGGRWAVMAALLVAFAGLGTAMLTGDSAWGIAGTIGGAGTIVLVFGIARIAATRQAPATGGWAILLDRALRLHDSLPAYLEAQGAFRAALEPRVAAALDPDLERRAVPARHWMPLVASVFVALLPLVVLMGGDDASAPWQFPFSGVRGVAQKEAPESPDAALIFSVPDKGELPNAVARQRYEQKFEARGGSSPYGWQIASGMLPPGIALDFRGGEITGVPTVPDDYRFTVRVLDTRGRTATRDFTLKVVPPGDGGGAGGGSGEGGNPQGAPEESEGDGGGAPPPDVQPEHVPEAPRNPDSGPGDKEGTPPPPPEPPKDKPEIDSDTHRVKPRVDEEGDTWSKEVRRWIYSKDGEARSDLVPGARELKHPGENSVPRTKVTTRERTLIDQIYRKLTE